MMRKHSAPLGMEDSIFEAEKSNLVLPQEEHTGKREEAERGV